jgi:glycosyltransferase involved in cell wall biosynthesis
MLRALFLTYDGLLDPLGGSQILPYLKSIRQHPRQVHIISFEKPERIKAGSEIVSAQLKRYGIGWTPLSFTRHFGILGKVWDLFRMYSVTIILQVRHKFDVIHCRSYLAMQVGCLLRRLANVRIIFDMRGLWVDDRVEGGLWPQDRLIYRLLYRHYKQLEKQMLEFADHIVVLTERAVPEIYRLAPKISSPVTVIPCCADFDHFVPSEELRLATRVKLGFKREEIVFSYLGSLGTVYLLNEMLQLFATVSQSRDDVRLLIITRDWQDQHEKLLTVPGLDHLRPRIQVRPANREDVPILLSASDIMLSFRLPTYSQMACSPTKLAEAFALGIPVISNAGVGDVDEVMADLDAGIVIDLADPAAYAKIAFQVENIIEKGGERLRKVARKRFGLEVAEVSYRQIYAALEKNSG